MGAFMVMLVVGVLLWAGAHALVRLAPARKAAIGGRPVIAILVLISLVLMVTGYRGAEGTFYWGRSPALTGINNLLVLLAVWLCACGGMKTYVGRKLREPVLWGVVLWAVAHILVNGDTPSFVLFGGLGLWALAQMGLKAATMGPVVPLAPKPAKFELFAILGAVLVYGAAAGVHAALGYPVFG